MASNKREVILSGTVDMLRPFLEKFSWDHELRTLTFASSKDTSSFDQYRIINTGKNPDLKGDIGIIATQQLPDERVLITFDPNPAFREINTLTPEQRQLFQDFVAKLIVRLAQLGFIQLPDPPKKLKGFDLDKQS